MATTPNGIPIQPGYNDPYNPYDTGRAGERNAELNGGHKNTESGWDYDAGRPRPGAVQQSNGEWVMPGGDGGDGGGDGGGLPPGAAAAIAQELALAKQAYDTALAKITNQRQTLGRNAGFTFDVNADTGMTENLRVDPHAIYGTFQLLNRQQAQNIENARATAIERGLGAGGGLGKQLQSEAHFQAGQQDAQFSSQLTDQFAGLATDQQQAKQAYDAAKYQAELDKIRMALANGNYGGGGRYIPQANPVQTQYVTPSWSDNQLPAGTPTPFRSPRDFLNL